MFANQYYCLVAGLKEYTLDADVKGFDAPALIAEIDETGALSGAATEQIRTTLESYKKQVSAKWKA